MSCGPHFSIPALGRFLPGAKLIVLFGLVARLTSPNCRPLLHNRHARTHTHSLSLPPSARGFNSATGTGAVSLHDALIEPFGIHALVDQEVQLAPQSPPQQQQQQQQQQEQEQTPVDSADGGAAPDYGERLEAARQLQQRVPVDSTRSVWACADVHFGDHEFRRPCMTKLVQQ
jgi:hypothetical protein